MTDAPPGRYKVVERGRRLVVIDMRTGQPATRETLPVPPRSHPVPRETPVQATEPNRIDDRSGAAMLRTSPLYDLKGPREIVMTDNFANRLGRVAGGWLIAFFVFAVVTTLFFPLLWLIPLALLFQPKVRNAFRSWATARLDAASQAAS